ncbi:MAG: OmpA family protein [Syntrophaceae bacterium]|nr:OmpA family protein [Syntrophaceae bacterium]
MKKDAFVKLALIAAALLVLPALTGCMVKESTYLKKVAEQEALQQKYNQLDKEKADLLQKKMECDRDLKSSSDELKRSIAELRQKNADLQSLQKKKEEIQTESQAYKDLLREMKGEMARGQVTIEELKGKLTLGLADQILFDSGQSEVKKDGLAILKRIVDILGKVQDKAIRVEGHTDNVKISGRLAQRFPTNWELSAARAINVARFLEENGIDPKILSAAAYGEYKPVADNSTPEGRQKNRRIAIILLPKD